MIKKLINNNLFKVMSKTALVKGGGMAVGILLSITMARLLGADGLGTINLANQLTALVLMFTMLGMPTVITKEVAIAVSKEKWNHVKNVIATSLKINISLGVLLVLVAYLIIPSVVDNFFEDTLKIPLTIIVTAVLFQIFSRIFASGLNGYSKIWQSSLVNEALSYLFVGIGLLVYVLFNIPITIISTALLYAISRALVALIISVYWYKVVAHIKHIKTKEFIPKPLLKVALPMLFIQATNNIASNIDSVMIGSFLSVKEVGIYAVAFKIAFVSSFLLMVTNAAIAPKIAAMYANKEIKEMEKLVQKITRGLAILAILSLIIIFFAGKYVLLIWGDEFTTAYLPLLILSIGQFFNIAAGCVGLILTLCNQEKIWGMVTLLSAVVNSILNIVFIQLWGIIGAAIASATTMSLVNILGVILVKKKTGVLTFGFPKL